MKKIFSISILFFLLSGLSLSQSLQGEYFLGDMKVSITMDYESYYVIYPDGTKGLLQYEENTPANDQIWTEKKNGKRIGTWVFKSDHSSGIYTDYNTGKEQFIKKIN